MSQVVQILVCYRKNCFIFVFMGQLILFEFMKFLLFYFNCVVKSDVLQGGEYLVKVFVVLFLQILFFNFM